MGAPLEEVDLLSTGVVADAPTAGTFALNMIHREGAWSVRKGFGQVAQYDTSMSTNPRVVMGGASDIWGYSQHLGSYLMRTRFGHMQVVSVLRANNAIFNARTGIAGYLGQSNWLASIYCLSIHDLTTGERWEEPVYRHTSEGSRMGVPLYQRLGQYLTARDLDADSWISNSDSPMWFLEWDGRLMFGNDTMGAMLYSPCTFNGNTRKFLDITREANWSTGHCESAAVIRVSPSVGLFEGDGEGYVYITDSSFPAPTAAVAYGDRVVYASGRNVFFSDPFYPTSIMALNVLDVPTDTEITALGVAGDTLLIFSATQTWAFRAPQGAAVTQGRGAAQVSSHVGCLNPSAVTSVAGSVIWCDVGGVYMSAGGSPQKLSAPIDKFFTSFITDPVTTWFPTQGGVGADSPTGTPPRRKVELNLKPELVTLAYSEALDALFVSIPGEDVALCYADSQWSVWSFESNADDSATSPDGAVQNIKNAHIICREDRVILVGGLDEQQFDDAARYEGNAGAPYAVNDDATSRSYYILEYGRGGAIDRSIDNEDYRTVTGKYLISEASASILGNTDNPHDWYGGWVTVDPWIKVADGYAFPSGTTANDRTFLLPVSIVPPKQWGVMPTGSPIGTRSVGQININLTFDSSQWQPVFSAGALIEIIVPSERLASVNGYIAAAGGGRVRAEDAGGSADVDGHRITIAWEAFGVAASWYHHPHMNLNALRKTTILYIPMKSRVASSTAELSGMAGKPLNAAYPGFIHHTNSGTGAVEQSASLSIAGWEQWLIGAPRKDDNVAQPVDWAYKSTEVGLGTPDRQIARGIAATVLSHGQGEDVITAYPFRLFNTLVAADQKMTMAQPVDYSGLYTWIASDPFRAPVGAPIGRLRPVSIQTNVYPNPGGAGVVLNPIDTLRGRLIASNNSLHQVTFDNPTAGVGEWGDDGSLLVNDGDVIIGDEQVDTIVTSDNLKCMSFSYLMFGFIQNRAETIKLEVVRGRYRSRPPGRRRRGR